MLRRDALLLKAASVSLIVLYVRVYLFSQVPKSLVLIGGGVIGLEMGSVWARLGSKVTVVEFLDRVCPSMDQEITKAFTRVLKKQGLKFKFKTKVSLAVFVGRFVTGISSQWYDQRRNRCRDTVPLSDFYRGCRLRRAYCGQCEWGIYTLEESHNGGRKFVCESSPVYSGICLTTTP